MRTAITKTVHLTHSDPKPQFLPIIPCSIINCKPMYLYKNEEEFMKAWLCSTKFCMYH